MPPRVSRAWESCDRGLEATYSLGCPMDLVVARLAEELTVAQLVVAAGGNGLLVVEFNRADPAAAVVRTRSLRAFARTSRPLTRHALHRLGKRQDALLNGQQCTRHRSPLLSRIPCRTLARRHRALQRLTLRSTSWLSRLANSLQSCASSRLEDSAHQVDGLFVGNCGGEEEALAERAAQFAQLFELGLRFDALGEHVHLEVAPY
jgi:hypothetical protein